MYVPPRPRKLPALLALARVLWRGDGDLLSLLPAAAFSAETCWLGWSRRSILLVNRPDLVRAVLLDADGLFPKSDLMVDALAPLIGESIFTSAGAIWRRQRRMIDPALSHMRLDRALPHMVAAVDAAEIELDRAAAAGAPVSLDLTASRLAADAICRAAFSVPLAAGAAREVFDAFGLFERRLAQVELGRLIFAPAFAPARQRPEVLAACAAIRARLADLIAPHLAADAARDDIASDLVAARDPETGHGFSQEELIDQLGVLFLAGHETSASALAWALLIAAANPAALARIRAEADPVLAAGPLTIPALRRLPYLRAFFKEVLRLYPPITFLPRVAARETRLGGRRLRRGALVMVAPWTLHRHEAWWPEPNAFRPERFLDAGSGGDGTGEGGTGEGAGGEARGAYLPFGLGPRVCAGAAFAQAEALVFLARLLCRYEFDVIRPEAVRPAARLTTRPDAEVMARPRLRSHTSRCPASPPPPC